MPPLILLVFALALITPAALTAQDTPTSPGVGIQVGFPSGVVMKWYRPTGLPLDAFLETQAIALAVVWNLDDAYLLYAYGLNEQPIEGSPLRYFVGPGLLGGLRFRGGGVKPVLGLAGKLGVNFFRTPYEVFLHLTPQVTLTPGVRGFMGGSIGLRYYF